MPHYSASILAIIAVTFFVAGIVKGTIGMGLPTVAMAALAAAMPPTAAAGLLIVPSAVTNVWQLCAGPNFGMLACRLWPMMLAILAATIPAAGLLTAGNAAVTGGMLGTTLVIYAGHTLLAHPFPVSAKLERLLSPLIGVTTGAVTGSTGIFVIPAVPYLQALGLEKDALVQALGLSFTVSTIGLGAGLAAHGALQFGDLTLSALAVIPSLAGMWVGQILRRLISPPAFRRWFLACLVLLGAEMLGRSLL